MARARRARDKDWEKKLMWALGLTAVAGGSYLGYQWYKDYEAEQAIKEHGEYITSAGINLQQVAIEINDAFYNYAYGTMEDEESAMDSLLTLQKGDVPSVALLYNALNGKNLYNDFREYLSNDQYNSVKHLLQ